MWPSTVGTEYGPQISQYTISKGNSEMWLRKGKCSLLCFASGQISQSLLKVKTTSKSTFFKEESLASEGCPNLRCHKEESTTTLLITGDCDLFRTDLKTELKRDWKDEPELIGEVQASEGFCCNNYNPSWTSPTPIILQQIRSCIKQRFAKKIRQQEEDCVSWLTDKRLKEKEGTQRTLWRTKVAEREIEPIWDTIAVSLFGSSTLVLMAVKLVNKWTECTIWSVAPVSIT